MIENGYTQPTIVIEAIEIHKLEDRWNENEIGRDSLKANSMIALVCALNSDEFNQVSNCEIAKQICDFIEITL